MIAALRSDKAMCLFLALLASFKIDCARPQRQHEQQHLHLDSGVVSLEESSPTGLLHLPLLTDRTVVARRRRKLQETPEEEEGHPQVVDALYQGYGEHVRICAMDVYLSAFVSNRLYSQYSPSFFYLCV